jgi:histidine phosphotransferase ChpT
METLELVALLSSRLCHDLVGPIGAVHNGLEILADETDAEMRRRAIELTDQSATEAARRLQFYRLAFGGARRDGASLGLDEARDAARGLFEAGKITLDWPDAYLGPELTSDQAVVKLLLNMIVVGAEALARGGALSVSLSREDSGLRLLVVASGPGANLSEETQMLLAGSEGPDAVNARSVQPFFTARLAEALNSGVKSTSFEVGRVDIEAAVASPGQP